MKTSKILSIIIAAIIGVAIATVLINKKEAADMGKLDSTNNGTQSKQGDVLEKQRETTIESVSTIESIDDTVEAIDASPIQPITSEKLIYMITLKTNKGDIELTLDAEKAPNTVENFIL